ncbi:MAG: TIGR04076 family protein [Bacillota bacterium]|jgi:uncharacterized repeat protein (TIGR04076 family)
MQVKVTVKSCNGTCSQGHRVGDEWTVCNQTVGGICFSAFCSLLPWIQMLRFDGRPEWDVDVACPDPDNQVVFRLTKQSNAEANN